jgi:hypothetical protein
MSEQIYNQALQEFTWLSLSEKKIKLLDLLNAFWTTYSIFGEVMKDIQTLSFTDNQYISIYRIIIKSMEEVDQKGVAAWIERIEQLHKFLMELRAKEAEEAKKEGNADEWLNQVLSTLQ